MLLRPPSMEPGRGICALEVGLIRLDTVHAELRAGLPAHRLSLGLSNVSAMFQQALTVGRYNLPTNDAINGGFLQAMDGMVLLGRQLRTGSAPTAPAIEALFTTWRSAATAGIAALKAATAAT